MNSKESFNLVVTTQNIDNRHYYWVPFSQNVNKDLALPQV